MPMIRSGPKPRAATNSRSFGLMVGARAIRANFYLGDRDGDDEIFQVGAQHGGNQQAQQQGEEQHHVDSARR